MGSKSRPKGYFNVKACMKPEYRDCINRDVKCGECYFINGRATEYDRTASIRRTDEEAFRQEQKLL